ncbi:choice-of-anchor O protein, partial [Ilumatobacter sp.]|uniref:choice-of-anchor O protein n=1 Tax=Ilumatobacter sp. TaxID=1967498 RepID=UPI003AF730EB
MRTRKKMTALLGAALLIGSAGAVASADDGDRVSKSMSHDGSLKGNVVPENEHAFIKTMNFYVPTQRANGTVEPVEYYDADGALRDTRVAAKPLVGVYINGEVEHVDGVGFVGHGVRDAYAAVSLDDGETYKNTNLSESADESSSDVIRKDIKLFKDTKGEYPGDVVNIFHAVAGDKVLVAWPSRYCSSGQPNYSLDSEEAFDRRAAIAAYLGIDLANASPDDLYLVDMYRVAGQQGSIDYAEDKWEQNHAVGEVPFSCVWTARGQLVDGDDPRTDAIEETYLRWFKAERLTSGRRDANRIEVKGVEGAGFAITWQEDPDGLRPGQGLGPGEGWSGAIGNSQTDVWYSYIDWEDVDIVQDPAFEDGTQYLTFEDYTTAAAGDITQKPKPFVPFAMPMPITDNAKCNVENPAPYCWGSALQDNGVPAPTDSLGNVLDPLAYGMKDMCAATVDIPTGQDGTLSAVCVPNNADGTQAVPLVGNTAATRARLNLFGYDSDADGATDSAFAVVQMEEDKGLGRALYDPAVDADGVPTGLPSETPCTSEDEKECIAWDIGKNQWYHTFSMSLTDGLAADPVDGLVANLTFHGHMLNQPEIDWTNGAPLPILDTGTALQYGEFGFPLHNTEIARRGSMLAQGISAALASNGNLLALPTWKQGQMNQGGPADVMSRRIVIPETWTLADGNPYAFRNMECAGADMLYADGSNPYYPGGLCPAPAINMSGSIPDAAIDSQTGGDVDLPIIDPTTGASNTSPFLRGVVQGEGDTTKVLSWHQGPFEASSIDSELTTTVASETESTLDDQSWYNPYEVAKGHRGFLDGDFVMMLYAWSPNWRLNTVGHDRYEL